MAEMISFFGSLVFGIIGTFGLFGFYGACCFVSGFIFLSLWQS